MKIDLTPKLGFDDVLILPQRSTIESRSQVELERTFKFLHSPREWTGIPIMCSNMSFASIGLASYLSQRKVITCLHKYHDIDRLKEYLETTDLYDYLWVSVGNKWKDVENIKKLGPKINICIDVPNGHMDSFVKFCSDVREEFPESIIMAGNITHQASCQELLIHGKVDICKINVGPGRVCTTRIVTGCGLPEISCIDDNSYVAHGIKSADKKLGLVCSDGGCKNSGDMAKAFAAGADFCMVGSLFAGTIECSGEWSEDYSEFTYYGMSTHKSQEDFSEGKKDYRASEGTKITVKSKGPVLEVLQELLGGIRSACSYAGATTLKDLPKCASFCVVNKIHQNNSPILGY